MAAIMAEFYQNTAEDNVLLLRKLLKGFNE
jgi:hypothetical protein